MVSCLVGSIKRITEFLNAFNMSCSGRLAALNSKLSLLERKVAFLESKVEIFDKKKVPQSKNRPKLKVFTRSVSSSEGMLLAPLS